MRRASLSNLAALSLLIGVGVAYAACGDEESLPPPELPYDLLCPSRGSSCENAAGPLRVGVATRDITPPIPETFCDCGLDGICPDPGLKGLCPTAGYTGPDSGEGDGEFQGHPTVVNGYEPVDDVNGNGYFDAVWIAGFGNARPAQGVHDPIWARAVVLEKGDTRLAVVALDLVGYFFDEVKRIRDELDPALGIDLVTVSASHTHEAPDSIGIWGFDEGTTGVDPAFMDMVRENIKAAITEAAGSLTEANLTVASGRSGDHPVAQVAMDRSFNNIVGDYRDPVVIDPDVRVLQFTDAGNGDTIASIINWTNHPESLCSRNAFISSDFVHWLREGVENGINRAGVNVPGIGGTALFINGAVGGMQSPGRIEIVDLDGTRLTTTCTTTKTPNDPFFARPRAFGQLIALDALRVLNDNGQMIPDPELSFATKSFELAVENWGYHAMFLTGVFYGPCSYDFGGRTVPARCLSNFDRSKQITETNLPHLTTEVAVINIGNTQSLAVPGELLPEYFLGGYDGSFTGPEQDVIDVWFNKEPAPPTSCTVATDCDSIMLLPGRPCVPGRCQCMDNICKWDEYNPPDLSRAPPGPYLIDHMTRDVRMVWGLTPDELGYIIPPYDFVLHDRLPYVEEGLGDHYEETNSIGDDIGPEVEKRLIELLEVVP